MVKCFSSIAFDTAELLSKYGNAETQDNASFFRRRNRISTRKSCRKIELAQKESYNLGYQL